MFSSSSRSHSTNGSSGPPPAYNETVGRVGTLRSQDSGLATGSNSSGSTFQIRDKKLENSIKRCLLDRGRLEVGDLIKEGNFGAVYKGYLNNHGRRELIAVKTLKVLDDNAHFEEFMKEGILTKGIHVMISYLSNFYFRFRSHKCTQTYRGLHGNK